MTGLVQKATGSSFTRLERIAYVAAEFVSSAQARLTKFRKDFDRDPHYAFSWGNEAIKAAALQDVGAMLQNYVTSVTELHSDWTPDQIAGCIVTEIEAELLRKARWPEHSTSAISNLIAQERTAAVAEFVSRMKEH